jgi:CheY-like chemotaxis protein
MEQGPRNKQKEYHETVFAHYAPLWKRGIPVDVIDMEQDLSKYKLVIAPMLYMIRSGVGERVAVHVERVVREALDQLAANLPANVTIFPRLRAGRAAVLGDPTQVHQVLMNLATNAVQAMTSGGTLRVSLQAVRLDAARVATIGALDAGDYVVLEVGDAGVGIPPEMLGRIFDPFFTTKEVGKGTGLGLTVAYAIVQEHGGRIRLESGANAGASFYVELPVGGGKLPPAPLTKSSLHAPVAAVAGASILVVEDETKLASAVVDALRDAGYIVEHAADGEQALAIVTRQPFDLVVCDLKMPRVDGPTFYRRLSESVPGLVKRVIFVTGDVAGTEAEEFLEESGCKWLAKPFRLGDLLRAVREGLV